MADMVSNNDIEDVLSSIRRLVSVDAGGSDRLVFKEDENAPQTSVEGRFVLTEAYRVPENESDTTQSEIHDDSESLHVETATEHTPAIPARRVLRLLPDNGELDLDQIKNLESEEIGVSDPDWNSAALFFSSRAIDSTTETGELEEHIVDKHDADADQVEDYQQPPLSSELRDQPVDFQSYRALEQTIAELEEAVGAQPDEWEPDGSNIDAEIPDRIVHFSPSHDIEPVQEDPKQDPVDTSVLTLGPADAVPQEDVLAHEYIAEDSGQTEIPSAGLLDEETLHELVTEIVRQELQGALGERITRNVRKLVRREIQIALAAKRLD